jgi:uncharacterized SAM-binding protein YcdF (DUF218 family)
MSFVLSKLFWLLVEPGNLLLLLALTGLGLQRLPGWRRFGAVLSGGVLTVAVSVAVLPVGAWLLWPLEQRFAAATLPDTVAGIIVLGGAIDPVISAAHGQPAINRHAERLTGIPGLLRRYPQAALLFSGGSGSVINQAAKEAPVTAALLREWGIDGSDGRRLLFEGNSRNTWENALASRDLVQPQPGEVWLLVTSASHMPRSVGIFRQVGWAVKPWPVDYQVAPADLQRPFPGLLTGLDLLTQAMREYYGLLAYRLLGRTDCLFPGVVAENCRF